MAPLDELETAVRRVAETWSRSQLEQAAAGAAANQPPGSPVGRPAMAGRGRPRRRSQHSAAAAAPSQVPLPAGLLLPPILPSLPLGPVGVAQEGARRRSHDKGAGHGSRKEPEDPRAGSAGILHELEPDLETRMSGTSQFGGSGGDDAAAAGAQDGDEPGEAVWEDVGGWRPVAGGGADWDGGMWGDAGPA